MDGETELRFTYGASHTQTMWGDSRHVSWAKLVEILTSHIPGPKEGSCIVPATFTGPHRKKEEAASIDVAFLDSDSGATLDQIRNALSLKHWEGVISSTHSHMSAVTKVALANWNRYFVNHPEASTEDFLISEKGYLPSVAHDAEVVETNDNYVLIRHQPCPKFRIALPLAVPWIATSYPSQAAANAAWKERIEALAEALSLPHDQACTDTSRLFYLPRRPPNGAIPEVAVISGVLCDIFSLPTPAPPPHTNGLFYANGHASSGAHHHQPDAREYVDPITGEVVDLVAWARAHGRSFLIASALRKNVPARLTGLVSDGKVHIDCPNANAHTDPGRDGATFVTNAGAGATEGFIVHCRHGHCTGKDRTFFVRRMLEEGWLSVGDLTSPDFSIGASDETAPGMMIATALADLDLDHIPPRRWIYGRELVRGYVSVIASTGGTGKTTYTMGVGVSVAANQPLLAPKDAAKVPDRCTVHKTGNVWLFNLEDPIDELRRRIKATLQHHQIEVACVAHRIFIDSGRDKALVIAKRSPAGLVVSPIVEPLVQEIIARNITVLIVDPFVQSHEAEENRNDEMNLVMALWGQVAHRGSCAVWLVHHFRKGGKTGDSESVRGAGAIQGAARSMFTVGTMTAEEADKLGVQEETRWQYIRHDNAKSNMAPVAGTADWYRLVSVKIGNGDEDYPDGDYVQAVEAWSPPSPWEGLPWSMIEHILLKIEQGPGEGEFYALGKQSKDRWAGHVIINDALKTDLQTTAILKAWKESGLLEEGQYNSPKFRLSMIGCVRVNQPMFSEMRRTFQTRTFDGG